MTRSGKIKLRMSIIIVTISLLAVAYSAGAESLTPGDVYTSLDGKRTIEVISKKELEITKLGDILLAQYNFRHGKLRVVYTAVGSKMVEYYELTHDGLKNKDGNILYSKKGLATRKELYNFFDVFKAAAMERNVEKIRNLTHPSCISSVNKDFYQRMTNMYFEAFDSFKKSMEKQDVRIEDITNKELLESQLLKEGLEFPVFPEKRISVSYTLDEGLGGGIVIMVTLHKGKWKWASFSPKNYENFSKKVKAGFNASAKSDVKNAYTTAMAYFADFPKGKIDMTKLIQTGFNKSEGVQMSVSGNQSDLEITASHVDGDKVYIINAEGTLTVESK